MDIHQFKKWQEETGYSTINDWNMQEINGYLYYFIKNYDTNRYALIKEKLSLNGKNKTFEVLVMDWIDYNNW